MSLVSLHAALFPYPYSEMRKTTNTGKCHRNTVARDFRASGACENLYAILVPCASSARQKCPLRVYGTLVARSVACVYTIARCTKLLYKVTLRALSLSETSHFLYSTGAQLFCICMTDTAADIPSWVLHHYSDIQELRA